MIGRLKGKILEKSSEGVILDVGGVGYEVTLPLNTLASLPPTGQEVSLQVHTHVREDELKLFGFASLADKKAFRTMIRVSGVGPKVAMAVLGVMSGDQLARAIGEGDVKRLTAIPGIGRKTAERIVLELGGKLDHLGAPGEAEPNKGVYGELLSALKNLGFKPAKVELVVKAMEQRNSGERPFEELLRQALASLRENS